MTSEIIKRLENVDHVHCERCGTLTKPSISVQFANCPVCQALHSIEYNGKQIDNRFKLLEQRVEWLEEHVEREKHAQKNRRDSLDLS